MRLGSQYQKSSLKGIFRVMGVLQHAPACAEDHGSVAADQRRKRLLVATFHKALEQFPVGCTLDFPYITRLCPSVYLSCVDNVGGFLKTDSPLSNARTSPSK